MGTQYVNLIDTREFVTIKICIEIRQILSGRNTSQYVSIVFITRGENTFTHRVVVVDVQDTKRSPSLMRRNYLGNND